MEKRNGLEYAQNYDVIVKWIAEALTGQTLEAIGMKTGRIEEVFGFEPVDISVAAGRVDVMARDENDVYYHVEEQRDLRKSDMYRFAAYHFSGAKRWGDRVTDVILASGNVYPGEKKIATASGRYEPVVVDFSGKNCGMRLDEIRAAAEKGDFDCWLELVFLPLYGKETGQRRFQLVERVIRFETELFRSGLIPARLIAATLIMSNKLIDKDRLNQLWEDIKMLDILEIAREKGLEEGKAQGIEEGKAQGIEEGKAQGIEEGKARGIEEGSIQTAREMLLDALIEKFGVVPSRVLEKIKKIDEPYALKSLFRQVFKCGDIDGFEENLNRL